MRDRQKEERSYYAASTNGPSGRWNPSGFSDGDTDIIKDGVKVRARIRDLERNNAQISGAFNRAVLNVVGDGMKFQSKVNDGESIDIKTSNKIEDYFEHWGKTANVNNDSFFDIQGVAFRTFIRDGEAFVIRRFDSRKLKYQVIEPDQLDQMHHGILGNNNYAIKGIEFNPWGRPVSYRVLDAHPGDAVQQTTRYRYQDIPASDVFHIFNKKRPSQRRGISEYTSIILDVFDSAEYTDATMTIARLAAAYGIFIETPYPAEYVDLSDEEVITYDKKSKTKNIGYVAPAAMNYMRPGEVVKSVSPAQPGNNYEAFIASRDRRAAVGVGQSYESFAGDYSKSTYSSARQGMLLERQLYRFFSSFMDKKLNYPVLEQVLDYANLSGELILPGYFIDKTKYLKGRFTRPRHEWIDLENEANSNREEIKLGVKTRRQIAEDRGDDWEDLILELSREEALMKKLGLAVPQSVSQGSSRPIVPDTVVGGDNAA
jgi:lambda family phage portal protein